MCARAAEAEVHWPQRENLKTSALHRTAGQIPASGGGHSLGGTPQGKTGEIQEVQESMYTLFFFLVKVRMCCITFK